MADRRNYDLITNSLPDRLEGIEEFERRLQIVVDALWDHLHDKGVSWVGF